MTPPSSSRLGNSRHRDEGRSAYPHKGKRPYRALGNSAYRRGEDVLTSSSVENVTVYRWGSAGTARAASVGRGLMGEAVRRPTSPRGGSAHAIVSIRHPLGRARAIIPPCALRAGEVAGAGAGASPRDSVQPWQAAARPTREPVVHRGAGRRGQCRWPRVRMRGHNPRSAAPKPVVPRHRPAFRCARAALARCRSGDAAGFAWYCVVGARRWRRP